MDDKGGIGVEGERERKRENAQEPEREGCKRNVGARTPRPLPNSTRRSPSPFSSRKTEGRVPLVVHPLRPSVGAPALLPSARSSRELQLTSHTTFHGSMEIR